MKKILIIMLFSFILIYLFPMQKVVAYSTGNGYYGTEIEGYEIIDTQYKYTKGTRILYGLAALISMNILHIILL